MLKSKDIISKLGKLGSNYQYTAQTFPTLDLEKVKKKLNLEEEAKRNGQSNLPSESSTEFDYVEQQIVSVIGDEINKATEAYHDHMTSFQQRISLLQSFGNIGDIKVIVAKAEGGFATIVQRDLTNLHVSKKSITESETSLSNFRKSNNINWSARYPDSKFFYYALALLLMLIETPLNGYFFAKGNEMGLLGGIFTAFIPAFLNVFIGYLIGNFACRYAIHNSKIKKFSGIISIGILSILSIIFNLFITHYRASMAEAIDRDFSDAATVAFKNFISSPLNIQDIESWLLFLTGCTFASIAALDFWKMDDPYPGYGPRTREHNKKVQSYAYAKERSLLEIDDLQDTSLADMQETGELITNKVNEATAIIDAQERWKMLFSQHLKHLESAGRQLLAYYRAQNMSVRENSPPAYFNETWHLEQPTLTEGSYDFSKVFSEIQSESQSMKRMYSESIKRISDSHAAAIQKYQTVEQLQPENSIKWADIRTFTEAEEHPIQAA